MKNELVTVLLIEKGHHQSRETEMNARVKKFPEPHIKDVQNEHTRIREL